MKFATLRAVATMSFAIAGSAHAAGPADTRAIQATLIAYQKAIEQLDATGTQVLFTDDSQVFESGGAEGNYEHYLAHHLRPELAEFKSFKFADYKVSVRFEGPIAIATESYTYRIEPKTGDAVDRRGVSTSVLRKVAGKWLIVMSHNSSRKPKAP